MGNETKTILKPKKVAEEVKSTPKYFNRETVYAAPYNPSPAEGDAISSINFKNNSVTIKDGDTFTYINNKGNKVDVRTVGYDAPETEINNLNTHHAQKYGEYAKKALNAILGKASKIELKGTGREEREDGKVRELREVFVDGIPLKDMMYKLGGSDTKEGLISPYTELELENMNTADTLASAVYHRPLAIAKDLADFDINSKGKFSDSPKGNWAVQSKLLQHYNEVIAPREGLSPRNPKDGYTSGLAKYFTQNDIQAIKEVADKERPVVVTNKNLLKKSQNDSNLEAGLTDERIEKRVNELYKQFGIDKSTSVGTKSAATINNNKETTSGFVLAAKKIGSGIKKGISYKSDDNFEGLLPMGIRKIAENRDNILKYYPNPIQGLKDLDTELYKVLSKKEGGNIPKFAKGTKRIKTPNMNVLTARTLDRYKPESNYVPPIIKNPYTITSEPQADQLEYNIQFDDSIGKPKELLANNPTQIEKKGLNLDKLNLSKINGVDVAKGAMGAFSTLFPLLSKTTAGSANYGFTPNKITDQRLDTSGYRSQIENNFSNRNIREGSDLYAVNAARLNNATAKNQAYNELGQRENEFRLSNQANVNAQINANNKAKQDFDNNIAQQNYEVSRQNAARGAEARTQSAQNAMHFLSSTVNDTMAKRNNDADIAHFYKTQTLNSKLASIDAKATAAYNAATTPQEKEEAFRIAKEEKAALITEGIPERIKKQLGFKKGGKVSKSYDYSSDVNKLILDYKKLAAGLSNSQLQRSTAKLISHINTRVKPDFKIRIV